jgi:phospholipase C
VSAIRNGPDWNSTTILITYDDCGCFYDHVTPPGTLGVRVPMIIVSPYAKRGYTDSTQASFASMLAYTEHVFELAPLATDDANAYAFGNSFDYTQPSQAPAFTATRTAIPPTELRFIADNPPDPDDPT